MICKIDAFGCLVCNDTCAYYQKEKKVKYADRFCVKNYVGSHGSPFDILPINYNITKGKIYKTLDRKARKLNTTVVGHEVKVINDKGNEEWVREECFMKVVK